MKRIAVLLAVLVGLVWVGSQFGPKEVVRSPTPAANPAALPRQLAADQPEAEPSTVAPTAAQQEFLHYLIRSGEEPKVKDATWASEDDLYVGVISDGTSRDGFAEYLCSVAADHGLRPDLVKIVDLVALKRTGKFAELGKAYCQ